LRSERLSTWASFQNSRKTKRFLRKQLLSKALEEGMDQINDRGYAVKFEGCGKVVLKVAFAFLGRDDIEMRMEKV